MPNRRIKTSAAARTVGSIVVLAATAMFLFATTLPASSQSSDQEGSERKVVSKVEPEYPETLKRLYIGGVVRVEVSVSANGTVESTQLLGGNPILGQSAMKAIKQWKYAPASSKTKFVVKVEFDPHYQ